MSARVVAALTLPALLVVAAPAAAVKYMSIGDAVKKFIPQGSKVVKVTHTLSAADRKRVVDDYGWSPDEPKYSVFVGRDEAGKDTGYVFVIPEIFNTCFHKYAIGVSAEGKVLESVVVELTCPRSFPVRKKTFLKQFKAKSHKDPLTTRVDIDAITGATLSSEAASTAARKAVSLHNLFFGGAQAVVVDDKTRQGRDKAAAMIRRAIETGETLKKEGKEGAAQLPPEEAKGAPQEDKPEPDGASAAPEGDDG